MTPKKATEAALRAQKFFAHHELRDLGCAPSATACAGHCACPARSTGRGRHLQAKGGIAARPMHMRTTSNGFLAPPADRKRYCNSETRARAVTRRAAAVALSVPATAFPRGAPGAGPGCGGSVGR